MLEKIITALEPIIHAINNKIVNVTVATGIAVAGKVSQESSDQKLKSLSEIPVTEIFQHEVSAASAATYIGSAYIILQFTIIISKWVIWLWGRYRARND